MGCVTSNTRLVKQPDEYRQFSMQFSELLSTEETIVSAAVESSPTGLDISDIEVSGTEVKFWIGEGIHLKTYRVEVTITTSSGAIVQGDGLLDVLDS